MSKMQLDYANYRTNKADLPTPAGCYRSRNGLFVMLYDPAQARPKSVRLQARTMQCISQVAWPQAWLHWFEKGLFRTGDDNDNSYRKWLSEISVIAYHLLSFSQAELEKAVGPCIQLRIQPMIIHRHHSSFITNRQEQGSLLGNLLMSYRDLKAVR